MAGINELIAKIQRFSSGEVNRAIMTRVADAALAECLNGFAGERNPYGEHWEPRKDPRGTWPILQKTRAGVDGLTARVVGRLVVLRIAGYFRFHQSGTRSMVDRKVFPVQSRGLGSWAAPIRDAARSALRELAERA